MYHKASYFQFINFLSEVSSLFFHRLPSVFQDFNQCNVSPTPIWVSVHRKRQYKSQKYINSFLWVFWVFMTKLSKVLCVLVVEGEVVA
jgi:hypothetical protein